MSEPLATQRDIAWYPTRCNWFRHCLGGHPGLNGNGQHPSGHRPFRLLSFSGTRSLGSVTQPSAPHDTGMQIEVMMTSAVCDAVINWTVACHWSPDGAQLLMATG